MGEKKRKGTRPQNTKRALPSQPPSASKVSDHPIISLHHLQGGWGFEELKPDQCKEFSHKWAKRSAFTWSELAQHPKHGLGSEFIPRAQIKPSIPRAFEDQDRFRVYRHEGNLPLAGVKIDSTFHVIWIEAEYNDLYDHG